MLKNKKSATMMSKYVLLLVLILFNYVLTQVEEEEVRESHRKYAEMMKHDGKKRVVTLDAKNISKLLKKNHIVVAYFWMENKKETEKMSAQDMAFLESVAQTLEGRKTVISTCEIMANQKFAVAAEVRYTGMIKIFNHGKVSTYSGQRSPDVLIPYLFKMLSPPVVELQKKGDKKSYDVIDLSKVVAYMGKGSKEFKEFAAAALSFQPMIPFFVTFDAKIAKSLHLKKLNMIQLVKPYEKAVAFPSKEKINEKSLIKFLEANKKQRLTKMRLENLHAIWAIDMVGYLVPIFANVKTEEGAAFFSLSKSIAKHFEKEANLTFVWIEPEPFPQMIEYWRQSFEIDPVRPIIGVVDVHSQTSAWLERPSENKRISLADAKQWLNKFLKGEVELKPMKTVVPKQQQETNKEEATDESEKEEL